VVEFLARIRNIRTETFTLLECRMQVGFKLWDMLLIWGGAVEIFAYVRSVKRIFNARQLDSGTSSSRSSGGSG
jgi:hypothetical protein